MDLFGEEKKAALTLADKYIFTPTSVLNTREPKWKLRKAQLLRLGIKSEIGRNLIVNKANDFSRMAKYSENKKGVTSFNKFNNENTTTSIFDPVICEIIYKWFGKKNVLDPFSGGSVRGILANYFGLNYTGIELRQEQVDSNREQALNILQVNNQPQWYVGDSESLLDGLPDNFDTLFTCPPYFGLEKYSELDCDLSNMNDVNFINKYNSIILKSCSKLLPQSFAIIVVGDMRDKNGNYKDLPHITKNSMYEAGMKFYNELIIVNPVGSKAMTLEQGFKKGKLAKVHQTILIFKKP